MIPAFVRRREPGPHLTYVIPPYQSAIEVERVGHDMQAMGATLVDHAPDPVRYSEFTGGRGRPVFPASQDVVFFINPGTMLGGEGSSWDYEHLGYKVPMRPRTLETDNPTTRGGANNPLVGYPGMVAWPERANEYRPPYEPYSDVVDQRTGEANPWANPRLG